MRWRNFGETITEEGRKVFFGGKEEKRKLGIGLLVHKDFVNIVMGSRPDCNRPITIRLGAVTFYIIVVQAYAPISEYDDDGVENCNDLLQNVIDQALKKDILVVQGD